MTNDGSNVVPFMKVEQARPFINGKCFDDLWGLPSHIWNTLCERELVWVTHFHLNGEKYSGIILAGSREQAEQIAEQRGLSEQIDGIVGAIVAA